MTKRGILDPCLDSIDYGECHQSIFWDKIKMTKADEQNDNVYLNKHYYTVTHVVDSIQLQNKGGNSQIFFE